MSRSIPATALASMFESAVEYHYLCGIPVMGAAMERASIVGTADIGECQRQRVNELVKRAAYILKLVVENQGVMCDYELRNRVDGALESLLECEHSDVVHLIVIYKDVLKDYSNRKNSKSDIGIQLLKACKSNIDIIIDAIVNGAD